MKKFIILFITTCFLLAAAPVLASGITWYTYDDAIALSKTQNKPVMLVFTADWCVFCAKLEANTFTDAEIARTINAAFLPVKVDRDHSTELVEQYAVKGIPDIVIIKPNQDTKEFNVVARQVGYLKPVNFQKKLNEAIVLAQ